MIAHKIKYTLLLLVILSKVTAQKADSLYYETASIPTLILRADSLSEIEKTVPKTTQEGVLVVSEESLDLFRQLENTYRALAISYRKEQNFSKAIVYYKKVLEVINSNEKTQAGVFNDIGACYAEIGLYQETFEYLLKAYNLKKTQDNFESTITTLTNLAHVQDVLGYEEDAYHSYKTLLKDINDNNSNGNLNQHLAMVCYNYGSLLSKLDSIHASDSLFNVALQLFAESNRLYEQGATYLALADNYTKKNESQTALINYKKGIAVFEQLGDRRTKFGVVNAQVGIINMFLKTKEHYKYAAPYIEALLENLEDIDNLELEKTIFSTLSNYYKAHQQYEKATQYQEKFMALKDSVHNKELIEKTTQLKVLYDIEKMEHEKAELINEQKTKATYYQEQKKLFSYLMVASSIIFILFIISLIMYVQKNRATKYLVQKNIALSQMGKKTNSYEAQSDVIKEKNKYAESSLSEDKKAQLRHSIETTIFKEKAYISPSFTLNGFAKQLGTNRNYISQIVNEQYHVNFSTFINEQRVKAAIELLSDPKNHIFTIDAIAHKVGFNSKSSFNVAFKKYTGITPSLFIKSIKETFIN